MCIQPSADGNSPIAIAQLPNVLLHITDMRFLNWAATRRDHLSATCRHADFRILWRQAATEATIG
jgi:hypothetical protein